MTNSFLPKKNQKSKRNPAASYPFFNSSNPANLNADSALGSIGKFAAISQNPAISKDLLVAAYLEQKAMRAAWWRGYLNFKHEVFSCRTRPRPGINQATGAPYEVSIDEYPTGEDGKTRHVYRHFRRCASAMVCPVCGMILRTLRGQEIKEIGERMLAAGYTYAFVSFTARHNYQTVFKEFVKLFQAAQRTMKDSYFWKELKKKFNIFTMRTVEVTDDHPDFRGQKSGFHFHNHTVIWLDRDPLTEKEAEKFQKFLNDLWLKALKKIGLDAVDDVGVKVELPQTKRGVIHVRRSLKSLANYLMKGAAIEMTGAMFKSRSGASGSSFNEADGGEADQINSRRVSIWTLLSMACERNDPALWKRWQTYAEGIKGISFFQLSPGLRDFCGLGKEKKDKELLDGIKGEAVRVLNAQELKAVVRQGGQGKLLRLADAEGLLGIERGIKAALAGCDILTGEKIESG